MPASQIEGNADVIMISETKLNDTFPVDQFVFEGFRKPFRINRNKNGVGILRFVREDIPAYQADLFLMKGHQLKAFSLNLICTRRIELEIFLTTKTTYPHM